jgi:peptidoglycan hydrolase-like protein with peptidoglycan-binding domain
MLKRGSSGPEVEDLQRKLLANKINAGPVDGLFGPKTDDAVRRFQEMHDLQVDGIVGPQTLAAFEVAAAAMVAARSQQEIVTKAQGADTAAMQTGAAVADARAQAAKERAEDMKQASQQTPASSTEQQSGEALKKTGGIFSRVFKRGNK